MLANPFLSLVLNNWKWLLPAIAAAGLFLMLKMEQAENERLNVELKHTKSELSIARQTITRIMEANNARNDIKEGVRNPAGNPVAYDQCLRTARTPANCERFLPSSPAD